MKKILFSLMTLAIVNVSLAQEAANKKFQAGIVAGFGLNFQNMGTKYMEKNGVGTDLIVGSDMNFMFTENIGLTTGVEFEFSKTKFKSGPQPLYYYFNDNKIIGMNDVADAKEEFLLKSRKQNSVYLTIPTMLVFRTKFIGYMRYFGKFGMRHSFLLNQRSNDTGISRILSSGAFDLETITQKNMKASNEVVFYKGSVGVSGGAEWNFTGSTCLTAEIGYYYGITPLYYNRKNSYLHTYDADNGSLVGISNKATQGQLQIKVGVMF
jgi:hypothetical protein